VINIAFRRALPDRVARPTNTIGTQANARTSRQVIWRVISHSSEPSSRLIWIYAISIGAFQGSFSVLALFLNARFQVTEQTIGYFFMYIGSISVFTRVLLLGRMVDWLGEGETLAAGARAAGGGCCRNAAGAKPVDARHRSRR
jgi:nitrate/nitrite transporter NarK